MRIAFVTPLLGDGFGMERAVNDSAELLREAGHETVFLTSKFLGSRSLGNSQVKVLEGLSSIYLTTRPSQFLGLHKEAMDFLLKVRPDVVHFADQFDFRLVHQVTGRFPVLLTAHTVAPSCPASTRYLQGAGVCQYKSGWRCLNHSHRFGCLGFLKNDLHRSLAIANYLTRRFSFRRRAHIAAISRFVQETLLQDGWHKSRVGLVYNPVKTPKGINPLPDSPNNLLVVATRLVPLKGIECALQALAPLREMDWSLWICGDGPLRKALESLAASLDISDRVTFRGSVPHEELMRIFASAKALLQTNLGPEGFGLSVAEASAVGAPVVAFRIPALDELIEHGKTGLLVERGNLPALTATIRQVLTSSDFRRQCKIDGPANIGSKFSPKAHLKATLDLYERALNSAL